MSLSRFSEKKVALKREYGCWFMGWRLENKTRAETNMGVHAKAQYSAWFPRKTLRTSREAKKMQPSVEWKIPIFSHNNEQLRMFRGWIRRIPEPSFVCATQGVDIPNIFRVIAILSRFYTPKTTKNQFNPLIFGDYRLLDGCFLRSIIPSFDLL